jgi:1-pyrroline-5-carboxylate dehydrogenase
MSLTLPPFRNEPLTDFRNPEARAAFAAALAEARRHLGEHYPAVIGGRRVDTPGRLQSWNPSQPDELIGTTAACRRAEAEAALAAATEAWPAWSELPAAARAGVLLRAAAALRRRKFEFAAWEVLEAGKGWAEADADVAEAIDFLEYYARAALRLEAGAPLSPVAGEAVEMFYQPMGVGVVHSPFNFPVAILCGTVSGPVAAGNAVVAKPSVHTPVVAARFCDLLAEAGLPDGVVNFLPADPAEVAEVLTVDPRVHFINFTGSAAVGTQLIELAARRYPGQSHIRRVVAELGGKDAILVDETADLDAAAEGIVASAFAFAGQKCSACSRAVAVAAVYEPLVRRVTELAAALRVGPAHDPDAFVTPVITGAAVERVLRYAEMGRGEARLLMGGRVRGGQLVEPTIVADVSPRSAIAREEIFGPLLALMRADDFEAALAIVNDSPYALTGSVYSRDPARLQLARRRFRAGNLYFNRKSTGALVGGHPFGGFGLSGTDSKAGGPDYLLNFVLAKSVAERF